ncbi:MAG: TolC family protein [Kofleriaceae bacterium]
MQGFTSFIPVALIAAIPSPVAAEVQEVATLTFEQAVADGAGLPELAGARGAAELAAKAPLPRAWAPLTLTFAPGFRHAPTDARGIEGGISLQQAIPLGPVSEARRATRDALASRRAATAAALALEQRLAAASAWIESWRVRALLASAERDLALARRLSDVTTRGGAVGTFTAPELADARAFVAEAVARRVDAEGLVADAAFELAATTHRRGRVLAEGDLPAPAIARRAQWPELVERARRLPAVAARRLIARAERARALEERAVRGRQLLLGGELLRDGPGALSVVASVGLTLPHDRGGREAALALADAAEAEGQAEGQAARGALELERALHDVEHTGELLAVLETELVVAADEAAQARTRAFELGETTVVELLAARRTALAAHARVSDAQAAHAWARVRAWLLLEATEVTP